MEHNDALYRLQQDLHLRGYSQSTERIYTSEVRLFLSFISRPAQELTEEDVQQYILHRQIGGLSKSTLNTYQEAIRFFGVTMNYLQIPRLKEDKKFPIILSRKEIGRLFQHCGSRKHKAMLSLAYGSGLLVSESCSLRVPDICKPLFGSAEKVLDYLGRYTHRVAVSNNRILSLEDGKVTFRWRDYSDGNSVKRMTLDVEEFIRRYLLHVLPKGFRKLRHYGLYTPRNKLERLKLCRRLAVTPAPGAAMPAVERLRKLLGKDFDLCPCCKIGHIPREPPTNRTAQPSKLARCGKGEKVGVLFP